MMLHAENETSYLPLIGIRQGGVVKQGRTVELTMSVDLSKAKIRTPAHRSTDTRTHVGGQ